MKAPSPLIPQGTFQSLDQDKANVRVAILTILAIHIIALGGFLMQGCKPSKEETTSIETQGIDDFPPLPTSFESNLVAEQESEYHDSFPGTGAIGGDSGADSMTDLPTNEVTPETEIPKPLVEGSILDESSEPAGMQTETNTTPSPSKVPEVEPTVPMVEHTIAKGETFSALAMKYGVPLADITEANPNLDPRSLQIGAVVRIPQPQKKSSGSDTTPGDTDSGGTQYVVKPKDTLTAIARQYGTTVAALIEANQLKSDRIVVGQKLSIPNR